MRLISNKHQRAWHEAMGRSRSLLAIFFILGTFGLGSTAYADLLDEELEEEDPHVEEIPDPPPPQPTIKPKDKAGDKKAPTAQKQPPPQEKNTKRSVLAPSVKKKPNKNAKKEPVRFESLGARGIREKGEFELVKDVVVTQGTLRMEADHAKVYVDQVTNEVIKVVADGKVKLFQEDEETGERLKAFGETMVFDNQKRSVVLSGNARLWRGANLIRGKHITYELDTGWIYADRVEGEVHTGDKDPEKSPPDGKKKGK